MTSRRAEAGFTLLENMAALMVLSVGLLGLLGFATTAIEGNASSKMKSLGVLLAQNKIEEAVQAGYNSGLTSTTSVTEGYGSITGYPLFQRTTVTEVNTPTSGMQTVTTTVSWNAGTNPVVLTALLSQ